jgi:hypothetical protein
MKKNTLLIAFTAVFLIAGSAWATNSKGTSNSAVSTKMSGTIVSASGSELVMSAKIHGKVEQETFAINPETKKDGDLTAGEHVMVHYRYDNGKKVATMISAHKVVTSKSK